MNRLKTLLFCPVFCLGTIVNAQHSALPKHRTGLRLSPDIGFGSSNVIRTNLADFYDLKSRAGFSFNAGVNIDYLFNDHIGVGIGVGVEEYSYSPYSTWIKISNHAVQSFIYIPVYFHVVTSKVGRIGIFANAGFAFHALTSIRYPDQESNYYTETVGYTKGHVSLQLFAGIHLPAANRLSFDIGPNGQYFVTNNFNSSQSRLSGHLASIGGKLALNIRLTK